MKIFDTLTAKEEGLDTSRIVRIYVCGVTVYDESHIGHARTIIVFDTLRRFLESQEIKVKFVQNFTDVDDKIINRAKQENIPPLELSSKFITRYFEDFDRLNIKRADNYPKATDHIQEMLELIKSLIEKNFAYVSKNGIYFSVSKFKEYGKLSKKKISDLVAGARIEIDETKNDPLDFALWKFASDQPKWQSPWGDGRPGWHIECSAMSLKYLGENFEIHGGGRDLIFPHHENEIAQSESHTGKNFAKIWMHVGMVTINGKKMSKSLGNTKSIEHVLKNWSPNIIRLFCLSGHYSKPIDYSEDALKETIIKWRQVENCYAELSSPEKDELVRPSSFSEFFMKKTDLIKKEFDDALNSDFNTSLALNAFFRLIKEINNFASSEDISQSIAKNVKPVLETMSEILGLKISKISDEERNILNELIKTRNTLREQKQYQKADEVRKQISDMGIVLIDHKTRTLLLKQEKISMEG
ncbi:MAG: cysteine--tRNA ligase [Thaumarchaeota archaeon]|nr:cysteine--tRNA ligase [Nitrososphaerota archaeon]MBI3639108.1 cysteine--tRNA ligase [Nitrososphaerota archaeon]